MLNPFFEVMKFGGLLFYGPPVDSSLTLTLCTYISSTLAILALLDNTYCTRNNKRLLLLYCYNVL